MAAEVTAVHDRGFATIKDKHGHPANVNVFELQVSFNQGKPEPVLCFCNLNYKESVAKSLARLTWVTHPREKEETKNDKGEQNVPNDDTAVQENPPRPDNQTQPVKEETPDESDGIKNRQGIPPLGESTTSEK